MLAKQVVAPGLFCRTYCGRMKRLVHKEPFDHFQRKERAEFGNIGSYCLKPESNIFDIL